MKILHITTSTSGGAGVACIRLHQGLLSKGISSHVLCLKDYANTAATVPGIHEYASGFLSTYIRKGKTWLYDRKLKQQLKNQPEGYEVFSSIHTSFDITSHPVYKEADIINLHWVSGFMDYTSFFRKNKKPVVWTMHDMFPFTGGCHHADNNTGFETDCGYCPQLQGTLNPKFAFQQLAEKKAALADKTSLHIVTPSQWLYNLSIKSALFKNYPHTVINNGASTEIFNSKKREAARAELGLPAGKKILLFVAQSVNNKRKGIHLLWKALQQVKTKDILLLSVGKEDDRMPADFLYQQMGTITDPEKIALVYQSADVFVLPSLAENLPNTIAESLLCGTPVIAFAVGGIPEMVMNEENGYSLPPDPVQLAAAIDRFFLQPGQFNRHSIEENAFKKYNLATQAGAYMEVYKKIMTTAVA